MTGKQRPSRPVRLRSDANKDPVPNNEAVRKKEGTVNWDDVPDARPHWIDLYIKEIMK